MRPHLKILSLGFALLAPLTSSATLGSAVYTLYPASFVLSPNGTNSRYTLSVASSGGLQATLPAGSPQNDATFYHYLTTPSSVLTGGNQYTAVITFRIATATTYPGYFYTFARPTVGGTTQYDIWQTWIGESGSAARTVTIPLDLAAYTAGTWTFYMGMTGPGSVSIDSFVIYNGTDKTTVLPSVNSTPVSNISDVTVATGATPITITPPAVTTPNSMTVTTLVANDTTTTTTDANALALQAAINAARAQHVTTLSFTPGTYYLSGPRAMNFDTINDLTIDGQGAVLVWRQIDNDGEAFVIQNCNRLVFKNLVMDCDSTAFPIASLGTVSNLSADKKQCDFTFPDLTAAQTDIVRTNSWNNSSSCRIFQMDPVNLVNIGTGMYIPPSGTTVTAGSAGNVLHVTFPTAAPLATGQSYCVRQRYYEMAAFKVLNCTNLTFDTVNIYSMPGMGWLFEGDSDHLQLVNCNIVRRPGSRTPLTTAADGIHVTESHGNLSITNCTFTGTGDDVINLHDKCYQAVLTPDPVDTKKLTLTDCNSSQLRISPNDTLQFYDPSYANLNGSSTAVTRQVATATSTGTTTVVTFTQDLPVPLSPLAIVRNTRFNTANVRIAGCQFIYTNGHGILLSTGDTTVERCYFSNLYSTPIQLEANIHQGVSSKWAEGHGVSNLLVQNNTFIANNRQGDSGGAAIWAGPTLPWGQSDTFLFTQLTFQNNQFTGSPGPVLYLNNCSNVVARYNRINYTGPIANATRYADALLVTRSEKLGLGGNLWVNAVSSPLTYGVAYDTTNTSTLNTSTNAVYALTTGVSDDFESYANNATFTTGQTIGAAGSGWGFGWRTAGSFATPTGTITNTLTLSSGQRLGASIVTQSGKTSSNGAVSRAYTASGLAQPFIINFTFRPDSTPTDLRYQLSDTQARAAMSDTTSAWLIASVNGTWQALNGPANGGPNTYVDTGIPVVAGTVYDFSVTVNPVTRTWYFNVSNGSTTVNKVGLNARSSTFATDTVEAPGCRWLNFAAQEIVTGASTVGKTGTFSLDDIVLEMP